MSRATLKKLENQLIQTLKEMLSFHLMIPGTFKEVYCKCGKKNCWCYNKDKSGHPFRRITWSDNGYSKTKAIPKKDTHWIITVTDNYRKFRKNRKKLRNLAKRLQELLDEYENDIIKRTRERRDYL